MATNRQRRRQLAREKWERQSQRRTAAQERSRKIGIVVGVIVVLAAIAGLVWLVLQLADDDEPAPTNPIPTSVTDTLVPTDSSVPTDTSVPTETAPSDGPTESTPTKSTDKPSDDDKTKRKQSSQGNR